MRKRDFFRLAALMLCGCLLTACAPKTPSSPDGSKPDFTEGPSSARTESGSGEAPAAPPAPAAGPAVLPYRAMWVSYLEWPLFDTTSAEAFTASVGTVFDNCVALGLNVVIVQVRPFSDAVYQSALYPWSHLVTGTQGQAPAFDPLAIMIEQAHARGLVFEAWINPYRVRLNDTMPSGALAANNPAVLHPEWVIEANGGLYYDPALPEVQQLVTDGVVELMRGYNVDGIEFDDYFYPTTDEAFDEDSFARYGAGQSLTEWRRGNVNALVQKVYAAVKAERPAVAFGISPQGNNDNNYLQQYSDIQLWLSTPGFVDYVMPQVYWGYDYTLKNGSKRFAFENLVAEWMAMPRDESVSLAFGLGAYRVGVGDGSFAESDEWQSGRNLADMVRTLAARGADGYGLYRYESLFGPGEYAKLQQSEREALAEVNGAQAQNAPGGE